MHQKNCKTQLCKTATHKNCTNVKGFCSLFSFHIISKTCNRIYIFYTSLLAMLKPFHGVKKREGVNLSIKKLEFLF